MLIVIFFVSTLFILRAFFTIRKNKKIIATDKAYIENYYKNHSWSDLPKVVVQIPLYNEPLVIRRTIDAVAALEYPHDRLEIQLLDDSTDDTSSIITEHLQRFKNSDIAIQHIRRGNKNGFKSGALDEGLKYTDAEYIAIFDADFIPPKDFLLNTVPHFFNHPQLAFIQTRWDYLNTFSSFFTKIQAASMFKADIFRLRNLGKFSTFRGSGGVWRKQAIVSSGGWYTQSLCEDSNLSMRAYYNNWQSKYLFNVCCLCELPENIKAYKNQRIRWSQGGMQNAIQMLAMGKSKALWEQTSFKLKLTQIKDFFVQSNSLLCFLCLLVLPSLVLLVFKTPYKDFFIQTMQNIIILLSFINIIAVYMYQSLFVGWKKAFLFTPLFFISQLMPLANYSFGIIKAILGVSSEFKRTPKSGGDLLRHPSLFIENQKEKIGYWGIVLSELTASSIFGYFAVKISDYSNVVAIPFFFFSLCFAVPCFLSIREAFNLMSLSSNR
ncbi:glycosyltransferase [Legionella fallonii]|uniref:Glucomannan 4-beta-mannosyltransferase n=1 Tax=Legionella fallonii LLAP-10 TaxID=1212491 RepID=A0A098GAM5_9GAMM|nr:glycosyltransferase [Legionella fallonii]CEG59032.1 Glucomannan 4-beta-mannosyltransferase [Legionella fallonii LLAP-10]